MSSRAIDPDTVDGLNEPQVDVSPRPGISIARRDLAASPIRPELVQLIENNPEAFSVLKPGAHGAASERFRVGLVRDLLDAASALQCMAAVLHEYPESDAFFDLFGARYSSAVDAAANGLMHFRSCRECRGES